MVQRSGSAVPVAASGFAAALVFALLATSPVARAQCPPRWSDQFAVGGMNEYVNCLTLFDDDGDGPRLPALYAGGNFQVAGSILASHVARWDGVSWSALQAGTNNLVTALAGFDDDGSGPHPPALYAAGAFTQAGGMSARYVAQWNGSAWSPLGVGVNVTAYALAVFDDDGAGPHLPALYVGGSFTAAGGASANHIAKWDGSAWSPVGSGVNDAVETLTVFDEDGAGPAPAALYAGGWFTTAGGQSANYVAKWDGSNWSSVGGGMNDHVWKLATLDEDRGGPNPPALYAGGEFTTAGGSGANQIAKWDGTAWSPLGGGIGFDFFPTVFSLATFDDDGSGPHPEALFAGGLFRRPHENGPNILKWDGTSWSDMDLGVDDAVFALASFDDDGDGPHPAKLYAGGPFSYAVAGPSIDGLRKIGTWDGLTWSRLDRALNSIGRALCAFDEDGGGPNPPALFVGGDFTEAGPVDAQDIARWDGGSWSQPGGGLYRSVHALTIHDADGSGPGEPKLYAGVTPFLPVPGGVVRLEGGFWAELAGGGLDGDVLALASFDPGGGNSPALYAGGRFTTSVAGSVNRIAQWNGTSWSALGSGMNDIVYALAVFDDDGAGPNLPVLCAGGRFTTAGGISANRVAKWDGTSWAPLGSGMNDEVRALFVFDDDAGGPNPPVLCAAGSFTSAGGASANRVAGWDGSAWSPLSSGTDGSVLCLTAFDDDGDGPNPQALCAGGSFTTAGGVGASRIAKWSGTSWSRLAGGITQGSNGPAEVYSLATFDDDGAGPEPAALYVAGNFTAADGSVSSGYFARWSACRGVVATFCPGDGTSAACPCVNNGASGHGCDNSSGTGGALLTSTGEPSLSSDSFTLTSAGEKPTALSTFWQGTVPLAPRFWGDGLRCVGGSLKRLYNVNASGGVVTAPASGQPSISSRSAALGNTILPGSSRYYQVSYRDPDPTFCPEPPGSTFNGSNGIVALWGP